MVPAVPPAAEAFPAVVFDAPLFRGLDARARREIAEAGRLVRPLAGGVVYRAGDEGASFFVVASGRIALTAVRRGDDRETDLRDVGPGESFGEESTVGLGRRATARALEPATVAEIPVHVFRRAAGRSGKAEVAERVERTLRRGATRDLLATAAFAADLAPRDVDVLLDAVTHQRFERGQPVYRQGDPAREMFVIADGMVQMQTEDQGRLHVRAYLTRGDFLGDHELAEGRIRSESAVASGPSVLLGIPERTFRELSAAHPELFSRLRRLAREHQAGQQAVVGRAAQHATQHAFRDLYRLEVARSLLVIDLESCARCGHCAWACAEVHGVARLVRRGDKIVARLDAAVASDEPASPDHASAPQHLMLPNSCQHCENPACMIDCPTGAIGRDPGGEVFIREALCTGCGACAKACPWDNIQMAARPITALRPDGGKATDYADLAVKCDLCRGYEGPACVQACPTSSIFRVNPAEEIADVRELLHGGAGAAPGPAVPARGGSAGPPLVAGAALAAAALGIAGSVLQVRGQLRPGAGPGLFLGVLAAVTMVALLGYAVPKRLVRRWMRPRAEGAEIRKVRSVVAPQLRIHLALGLIAVGLALSHSPWPVGARGGSGSALELALLATSALGGLTALAYRVVPGLLARLERTAALPEDFERARKELLDRLYREASGRSDLVKKILERILLPYARHPLGPLGLVLSGRRLREEEDALRARVDAVLEGRGQERLAGLPELLRIVVELRALPAQRWLLRGLRGGLPLHIVTFGIAIAMLVVHVALAVRRIG